MKTRLTLLAAVLLLPLWGEGATRFYHYYNEGLRFMEQKDWIRAVEEFKSAASLEFDDTGRKRIYGTRFIEYFPHREMGIAHYQLGEFEMARKELELSLAYEEDDRTLEYLERVRKGTPPSVVVDVPAPATRGGPEDEEDEKVPPPRTIKRDIHPHSATLPVGALTYDPARVTQVGSRLALAVIPFVGKGEAKDLADAITEEMIAQLVALRRFKVIERTALDKVLEEQSLAVSGLVDEKTATDLGKLAGADAIVLGSLSMGRDRTRVSARVIDTETGETILAKAEATDGKELEDAESAAQKVAILIYNELPIVEGYVVSQDPSGFYIDIGSEKGIRKGSKCVAFREGEKIKHPVTGEILGSRVTKLGELVVVSVHEKMAVVKVTEKEDEIAVGDKVVVK